MSNLTGPGQAALEAARRRGISLPAEAANEIAAAALNHADGQQLAKHRADRHQWGKPGFRQDLRQKLRRELSIQLADEGTVAAGPFAETLTYLQGWVPGAEQREVSAVEAENGDAPWDYVEVRVSVPVRTFE